jgi:hypothetical protein
VISRTIHRTRQGHRLLALLAGLMLISGTLVTSAVVLASTPAGLFELEGDATSANETAATAPDDWDRVCHEVTGADCSTLNDTNGATAVAWAPDTHGAIGALDACTGTNCTIFTGGGSKDPIDINQWAWKDNTGGLPDKDNLLHGFAARYSIPSSPTCPGAGGDTTGATKCEMLFFGNTRFDNSGDAQQGFWFFQNKIGLGTNAVGGGSGFTSSGAPDFHRNGDLLLISNFSNGGTTSTINVYTWDTSCAKGVNNPAPGQCSDANLRLEATSTNANCSVADPAISGFCGIVNPTTRTMPWPFVDKSNTANNQAINGEFYEGGVNLSALDLGDECFASIASESRSSTSTTAVLKDFVLGSFGECGSMTTTTPQTGAGVTLTDSNSNGVPDVSIGTGSVVVQDHAVVSVTGIETWAGSVAFSLCGPLAVSPTDTNCATGGVPIPFVGPATGAVSNATPTVDSQDTTLTKVGRYCWRGVFTATTSNVPSSSDPVDANSTSTTECFEVLPVTPTLTTSAGADVVVNTAMSDTATLTGTATKPGTGGLGDGSINPTTPGAAAGGTISFVVKQGVACTASGLSVTGSPMTVSGDRDGSPATDVYGPVTATPTQVGIYTFVATYTSNDANTNSAGPGGCPEATEEVIAGDSSITTTPKNGAGGAITDHNANSVPDLSVGTGSVAASDHAVVTVDGIETWSGSVQFYICGPLAYSPTTTNCATGGSAVGLPVAVSNLSATADAPSTDFTRAARYCWRAEFTSSTTGVPNSSDGRTSECFEVLPVTPTLATSAGPDVVLGNPITDTATLTGTANQPGSGGIGTDGSINPTTPGAAAGGTISFVVNGPDSCTDSGLPVSDSPVSVSGNRDGDPALDVYGPVSALPTALGEYTFVATYSGNGPNTNGVGPSGCPEASEAVIVTGISSLSTAQDWLPNDTATLTGDANLNGTLTFTLYNDLTCGQDEGTSQYTEDITVTDAASGSTFSTGNTATRVLATGDYSWLVHYDDTTLSDPSDSCEKTGLTITN